MNSPRLKRPKLERDRPVRTWSTLLRPPTTPIEGNRGGVPGAAAAPPVVSPEISQALGDTVETAYRVINEHIRSAQTVAQGFNPGTAKPSDPSSPDMQRLAQRVMQYGWDFAGLWFEMWGKMGGNFAPWPAPPTTPLTGAIPGNRTEAPPDRSPAPGPEVEGKVATISRLGVSVVSHRPTATELEFRPGPAKMLVVNALRAEGHVAPPITAVTVESLGGSDALMVRIVVEAEQPPGTYNGLIVDAGSHLPRGTLSVRIHGEGEH